MQIGRARKSWQIQIRIVPSVYILFIVFLFISIRLTLSKVELNEKGELYVGFFKSNSHCSPCPLDRITHIVVFRI